MSERRFSGLTRQLKTQAMILLSLVAVLWGLELLDWFFLNQALNQYGIQPRTLVGLRGIVCSPFLHGSLGHLAANTLPFIVLGWLIMLRRQRDFWIVTLNVLLLSGVGVWMVGRSNTVHIGASSLIFGYLGFLLLRGFFERGPISVAVSLLVGVFYGGLVWGVLPITQEESWEGHLLGLLAGIGCAWMLSKRPDAAVAP